MRILMTMIGALVFCPLVMAESTPDHWILAAQQEISESQAVAAAQARVAGKVLNVQRVSKGEKAFYRVRILTDDGRVRTVSVDAKSGRVSE